MKRKLVLTVLLWSSSYYDVRSTHDWLRNPAHYELNPIFGRHPSDVRLYSTTFVTNLSETIALWKAKGKLGKAAKIYVGVETANHLAGGSLNYARLH